MKREYTRAQIINTVKSLDKRVLNFTEDQFNTVIDNGYAELVAECDSAFSNEEIVSMADYYDASNPDSANAISEMSATFDVVEDVYDVYDLYLTIEGQPKDIYQGGVREFRDDKVVYRDNRYTGRVHVQLDASAYTFANCVIKYYYLPAATDDSLFLDSITMSALRSAFNVALNKYLHDEKRAALYLDDLSRLAAKIPSTEPEDALEQSRSIFATYN